MSSNAEKIINFLNHTSAFQMIPETYLKLTKNKLISGEWKVYRFDPRVKNDEGWEVDQTINGNIEATYCWTGNNEYCVTSNEWYTEFVVKSYQSKGECVFSV